MRSGNGMLIIGFQAQVAENRLGWLKRGFRHCFAYALVDGHWILSDPLARGLYQRASSAVDGRMLLTSLAALEITVVGLFAKRQTGPFPWLRPFTCVEFCKRLTGDRGFWPFTPRQLFGHLTKSVQGVDATRF